MAAGAAGIQTILRNVDGLQAELTAPASAPAAAPTPVCCLPWCALGVL